MVAETLWDQALQLIEGRVPKQVFDTWFLPVRLQGIEETSARLEVPNKFFADWLGQHYYELLSEALSTASGVGEMEIKFIPGGKAPMEGISSVPPAMAGRAAPPARQRRTPQLNPKYSFKSFVVGASNQFAHAASMAVADAPARAYNPLFIYGGVGLGKTGVMLRDAASSANAKT